MDTCLHCEACRVECPLSIDLPKLMWMARAEHAARHGRSLSERMLGNPEILAKTGRTHRSHLQCRGQSEASQDADQRRPGL